LPGLALLTHQLTALNSQTMLEVSDKYIEQLETIAQEMLESDIFGLFSEELEEEQYRQICETYEPRFAVLHRQIADNDPLQLVAFEEMLLNPILEGLFTPKLLGFAAIRGMVNNQCKYQRPQNHFKKIIIAICESPNFDYLRKRVGQSIQIGFALSSDIWITDLVNQFPNKKVRQFVAAQKLDRFREVGDRKAGYDKFTEQLSNENYLTADFPEDLGQLAGQFPEVKRFLLHRIKRNLPAENVSSAIEALLANKSFESTTEISELVSIYLNFFDHSPEKLKELGDRFNQWRKQPGFDKQYFTLLTDLVEKEGLTPYPERDDQIKLLLDPAIQDDIITLYQTLSELHTYGVVHTDGMDAIRRFYDQHEGASVSNHYLRALVAGQFTQFIDNVETSDYHEYMELFRIILSYSRMFDNAAFDQQIKDASMAYLKRLLVAYPERRSKEYLEIRRFVGSAFREIKFLSEKEIELFFKKPKPVASKV
jgi:hypothetical protein